MLQGNPEEIGRNDLSLFFTDRVTKQKSETMVVDMLHKIFTKRNYRIVVATPYENQVRLLFMRMNEILQSSPLLKKEVVKNTKNPYIIELANGSAIIGFTTGTDASSVRGQKADFFR